MTTTTTFENEIEQQTMLPQQDISQQHAAPKRGFTLTEIAIVLGIIGLILGAIWVAAAAVYNNLRVSKANTAVLQIAQGVRSLYATSNNIGGNPFAADLTPVMVNAGVIPSDLINGAGANSVWPGGITAVSANAATDTAFTVKMTNIPRAACISLLTTVGGTNRDQGLVAVGATAASNPIQALGAAAGAALPLAAAQVAVITPALATVACNSANANIVGFEFSIK